MDKVSTLQVSIVEHLAAKELDVNPQEKAETKKEQKHSELCVNRNMTQIREHKKQLGNICWTQPQLQRNYNVAQGLLIAISRLT